MPCLNIHSPWSFASFTNVARTEVMYTLFKHPFPVRFASFTYVAYTEVIPCLAISRGALPVLLM